MHAGRAGMHTITMRATELEKKKPLIYKGGNLDSETISDLSEVIQLVNERNTNNIQMSSFSRLGLVLKTISHLT